MDDKEFEIVLTNYVNDGDKFFEGPGINDIRYELSYSHVVNKAEMSRIIYLVMNHDDYKNYNVGFWRVK